jgi:hypothetical protein
MLPARSGRVAEGSRVTDLEDRIYAEIDRQLAEVRAACDGFATRAGLLIAATGIGASIFGARIGKAHSGHLLLPAFIALAVAALSGICTVIPWLKIGVVTSELEAWALPSQSGAPLLPVAAAHVPPLPAAAVIDPPVPHPAGQFLHDVKVVILNGNLWRKRAMHALLTIQAIATSAAVGLALWAARR